jgi:retron-type reverse transcriptase
VEVPYTRVVANQGAPGVDGMTVEDLKPFLAEHWPRIKEDLLAGRYRPGPVRGVDIPEPGGGTRTLGIPTVLDRLIQQAMHQALSPLFDPDFSASSFGFGQQPGNRGAGRLTKKPDIRPLPPFQTQAICGIPSLLDRSRSTAQP